MVDGDSRITDGDGMTEEHFRLVYDGPAVEDGEMEIGQLAPSLLALGKLLETVDAIVNGDPGRVRVKVKSDLKRGSFDVGIALDFVHAVKAWLVSPSGQAIATFATITGITGTGGLIAAVKWLNGRKVKTKVIIEDGRVRIETEDHDILVVPPAVGRIVDDAAVRQHLEKFTDPLRSDGIEQIRFDTEGDAGTTIAATEASAFRANAGTDPTSQAHFTATYQIKRLYFERGKKWRLSNGAQTILAEIEDEEFWTRVEAADARFSADDFLVCGVRMDQWLSDSGLKTEYVVERVMQHLPAPRQDRLPGT